MNKASNPVIWFEIYVSDMQRAKRFYENVFKQQLPELSSSNADSPMYSFPMDMKLPGTGGMLVKDSKKSPGAGGTLVYFSCEDCSVEAALAAQHGGKLLQPKQSIGEYGFIAIAEDCEGNRIGLHSMK
jgi:predicted enzyme related to lactoylglutathione lyase